MQGMALDIPKGVPFSARTVWIEDTLNACSRIQLPDIGHVHQDSLWFDLLVPLCHHSGFRSLEFFDEEVDKVLRRDDAAFCIRIRSLDPCASIDQLTAAATTLAGESLRIRKNGIAIRTDNIFTRSFIPPVGNDMQRALSMLIRSIARRIERRSSDHELAGVALGAYFTLMTLHPFSDGNGRTARAYFASIISQIEGVSSVLLLGMMVMHRHQGTAFHLAAKLARMGEPSALIDLFLESVVAANSKLRNALVMAEGDVGNWDVKTVKNSIFAIRSELLNLLRF